MIKLEKCLHPMLEGREGKVILKKIQDEMVNQGIEYLVLTNQSSMFYATGYLGIQARLAPGGTIVVVPVEGNPSLIISTLESADAYACTRDVDVLEYMSWVFVDDGSEESRREKGDIMDPDAPAKLTLELLKKKPLQGKVGLELQSIPNKLYAKLAAALPEGCIVDGGEVIAKARVIKTPWEIGMLRLAAQELDKAWKCVAADLKPGMPAWKLDALFIYYSGKFNLEHGTMSRYQTFIPAAGPYFGLSGMPRGYILKEGDVIKFDVGYKYLGYNSDIARTFAVGGTASDAVCQVYEALYKGNRLGVEMLKPGVKMSDVYHAVRAEVEKCPLIPHYPRGHVGHSIGCNIDAEEHPTFSPGSQAVLQENMVVCLETPYSGTGNAPVVGGFNLEDTHAITADGHDSFTENPDNIFWK